MCPRPRTVSDEAILGAAHRAMARLGPLRLTLAEVAREAGLSAATLVQRFGSKRGLLLAVSASAVTGMDGCFEMILERVRREHGSPLEALIDAATEMSRNSQSVEEMANHLAFLQIDVSDPDFHAHMLELSRRIQAGYRALLDEAVSVGEIVSCDTARLARAIGALAGGSLIGWAVFREGSAETWVRKDLDTLIGAYRTKKTQPSRRRRRRKPGLPLHVDRR
jgi:AcrR family transcriptional regulator